jgi:hypothetical protein
MDSFSASCVALAVQTIGPIVNYLESFAFLGVDTHFVKWAFVVNYIKLNIFILMCIRFIFC